MKWDLGTQLGKFLGIISLVPDWDSKVEKNGRGKLGGNFSKEDLTLVWPLLQPLSLMCF